MILGLHPEVGTDRITVLACDRTDRSGSKCTRPSLVAGSGGGKMVGSGLDGILIWIRKDYFRSDKSWAYSSDSEYRYKTVSGCRFCGFWAGNELYDSGFAS